MKTFAFLSYIKSCLEPCKCLLKPLIPDTLDSTYAKSETRDWGLLVRLKIRDQRFISWMRPGIREAGS